MLDRLNSLSWPLRWAAKCSLAAVLLMVVLFPRLDRVPTSFGRHLNPNALIEPDAPDLQPLIGEFDLLRAADWDDERMLAEIQTFVRKKVPYEWDWNIWSNADYFPTVAEALEVGREDCDGRAVVAASMLRHYGYDATLVTDIKHVWVETPQGATMGPGKVKAVTYSDDSAHQFNWGIVWELPGALSMGIAVFPLGRELILVAALWLLLIGRGVRPRQIAGWLPVMLVALLLVREGGHPHLGSDPIKQWSGLALIALAVLGMLVQQRPARRLTAFEPDMTA